MSYLFLSDDYRHDLVAMLEGMVLLAVGAPWAARALLSLR